MSLVAVAEGDYVTVPLEDDPEVEDLTPEQRLRFIGELEERMREAARKFEFEKAASLRDRVKSLQGGWLTRVSGPRMDTSARSPESLRYTRRLELVSSRGDRVCACSFRVWGC